MLDLEKIKKRWAIAPTTSELENAAIHARTDVPALIAEVERLRAYHDACCEFYGTPDTRQFRGPVQDQMQDPEFLRGYICLSKSFEDEQEAHNG